MRNELKPALSPAERLIVAADYTPVGIGRGGREWARTQVLKLADRLAGTQVYLKVNTILRACGYDLIEEIRSRGLRVFADLKLFDIPATLTTDGVLLREFNPELLTVSCAAGVDAMRALQAELTSTEVLGVTVLTSLKADDVDAMFSCSTKEAVLRLGRFAEIAEIRGLISSPAEAEMLREEIELLMSINTPAIRPEWSIVKGDDQNPERIMTPAKALAAGADRIVIGRPITQADDSHAAAMRTIAEIEAALA